MEIESLQAKLREFAHDRDWEQYHTPKNLSMALSVEAAELMEIFQWMTIEESDEVTNSTVHQERIGEELADIFNYLLRLADVTGIDLEKAIQKKLRMNAEKYPAAGSATPRSAKFV